MFSIEKLHSATFNCSNFVLLLIVAGLFHQVCCKSESKLDEVDSSYNEIGSTSTPSQNQGELHSVSNSIEKQEHLLKNLSSHSILQNNKDFYDGFDSPDYVLGQNAMDYGRGFGFEETHGGWGPVTMVDGNLEPLEEEIPYFEEDSPTQVTASVGAPAHIPCMVRNLGSKSLSWIRRRDLYVLTVGSFTFVNDERFSAHKDPVSGDWVLVIRQPQVSDSGMYVCSVSTKPAKTHSLKLNVVVPSAEMVGGSEVYLDYGSTLNLTCLIHYSPSPPEFVLWYHRDKLVNYGGRKGRIEVETIHQETTTRSSLIVRNATQWHSGRYSCKPANTRRVTMLVHVLKNESPAAMQTTTSGGSPTLHLSFTVVILFQFCTILLVLIGALNSGASSERLGYQTGRNSYG